MNAVDDVVQPFSHSRLWFVVKNISVDEVLGQRPEQYAEQKQRHYGHDRQLALPKRHVEHVANDRKVQNERSHWMHAREKFHEIALEHSNRFVLIRDVEGRPGERPSLV